MEDTETRAGLRVKRGAAMLDGVLPGWAAEIPTDKLDMSGCLIDDQEAKGCVLCHLNALMGVQQYDESVIGEYHDGLKWLEEEGYEMTARSPHLFGFDVVPNTGSVREPHDRYHYGDLDRLWTEQIQSRLTLNK